MAQPVAVMKVRPSTKMVKFRYAWGLVFLITASLLAHQYEPHQNITLALYALVLLWMIVTAARHLGLLFTTLIIDGERLLLEEGLLSKSTRSLNLLKVQDIKVEQGAWDRMLGVGRLTLETAGEAGRLTMANIDRPRQVADQILALARRKAG